MTTTSCAITAPAYGLTTAQQVQQVRDNALQWAQIAGQAAHVDDHSIHLAKPGTWCALPARLSAWKAASAADVIWAARGGYGCIELLAAEPPLPLPSTLIGYSDITALHAAMHHQARPSLYASHASEQLSTSTWASLQDFLAQRPLAWSSDSAHDGFDQIRSIRGGTASGPAFAGCLRVLSGLVGTPWQPNLSEHILVIEDIDERPYSTDRDLWQCYHGGLLTGVRAIISGQFHHQSPQTYGGPSHAELFSRWAQRLQIPWLHGLPCGHDPHPIAIACGWMSTLDVQTDSWTWHQQPDAASN